MPKLTIDGRPTEVPEGTNVLAAALGLGIWVPHFCYHEALGPLGACRLCAVKFTDGPVEGVQMSCMTRAQDGMAVSTTHPEAVDFRRWIIECLMLNHPHDCPVCDEGGHCFLQDMTVSGGHGLRRYPGKKRTYRDQYLGELVQHEMNRCIHCFRCRRFYQEFAGYRDLGALQIGNRTYFGRFRDGPLESPFSGNLIDICPTGVYTDRLARFKGRRWDFERAPSVCLHCSLGCNTTGSARFREMFRVEGRRNDAVNGFFICDRGRSGFDYANREDRPRRARARGEEVSWGQGVRLAAEALVGVAERHGQDTVACLGSARSSVETQAQLARLCEREGWRPPHFFLVPETEAKAREAVRRLDPSLALSLAELGSCDFVAVVGADPLGEAPMLALALRQAARSGATVVVIDPRPVSLPFGFEHVAAHPHELASWAAALFTAEVFPKDLSAHGAPEANLRERIAAAARPARGERLEEIAGRLSRSRRPAVVCGTDLVPAGIPGLAADGARLLGQGRDRAGLFFVLPGPNAFGAALLSPPEGTPGLLEAIEAGEVRALVLAETDPFRSFPDRPRWESALERLEAVVALDHLASESVGRAHFVLPTTSVFEAARSHYVNQEGRLQQAAPVHAGGTPLSQVGKGSHPPREYVSLAPGSDSKPGWQALSDLASALSGDPLPVQETWVWLGCRYTAFRQVVTLAGEPMVGQLLLAAGSAEAEPRGGTPGSAEHGLPDDGTLLVVPVELTFGTEELSTYSRHAARLEHPPRAVLHPEDGERLALGPGARLKLRLPGGDLEVPVAIAQGAARGVLLLPRHHGWEWQKLPLGPFTLSASDLEVMA